MSRFPGWGGFLVTGLWLCLASPAGAVDILLNENDFQSSPTTFIDFEDITLCSPAPCTTFINVDRYQPQGVHIADGTSTTCSNFACDLGSTSAAGAWSGTVGGMDSGCPFVSCFVPPHSGGKAIADSDSSLPAGCVVIRFVVPGTATPTSVFEAGVWAHGGKENDCVEFYDASQNLLASLTAPADAWTFLGVRASQGVRYIRMLGTFTSLPNGGGFLIDDLKFGGTPNGSNQPPSITQGASMNLSVRCSSDCPLAANNVTLSATDADGDPAQLMWAVQTPPMRGSLSPTSGTGANFTTCYDPLDSQLQADSFVIRVTDTGGAIDTITVNVTLQNDAPVIAQGASLPLTVAANSSCGCPTCPDTANTLNLSATDLETPGALLFWSFSTFPNTGTVCFQPPTQTGASISVRYTPFPGQMAADAFSVRVTDDCGGNDTINVTVTVNPACMPSQKGDLTLEGVVDSADVQRFTLTLLNPSQATAEDKCRADVGSPANFCAPDGQVTIDDIPGFTQLLLAGSCP
jgi:hypothetical protein